MKLLLTGNCQASGLAVFLRRALPKWEIRDLPHLSTFYGEFTEERIADDHAWADLVFFHHKNDDPQDYPTKQPKIPLSVWFQSAPFIIQSPDYTWAEVIRHQSTYGTHSAVEFAVKECDMDYQTRWFGCLNKMKEKEWDEEVPEDTRISDLMGMGTIIQLQLTCNHPTSYVFKEWCDRIVEYLEVEPGPNTVSTKEALANPNIANLPCEESATTAAVKHLGLKWGGRPEDDQSGREVAFKKLEKIL